MPTAAATTGFTTVSVASGAARPAPRYEACDSISPAVARTPIAASEGRSAAVTPPVQSTATVLVNTEDIPNAMPDAVASSTLRTTGCRCAARPAIISATTAAAVTTPANTRCAVLSDCASDAPTRESRPARPTVAMIAPRQAVAPALRPTNSAAIGSANTIVRAPSGCTRLSGP